ncbi:MAG: cytidine deaminase [Burkholderiales bacterium]
MPKLLNETLEKLVAEAKRASNHAYAPYSRFIVGAAVLDGNGDIFSGCNVENASYGLSMCAERNAIYQMVASAKRRISTIVIYTPTAEPTAPCGACRQVINEFGADVVVISVCDGSTVLKWMLQELLPSAFGPANLK